MLGSKSPCGHPARRSTNYGHAPSRVPVLVPRRPRPPLTAREIAAFLSGGRAARAMAYRLITEPELSHLAWQAAERDAPIAETMELREWLYWFTRGYDNAMRLASSCP